MSTIIIHDEETRRAAEYALWEHAANLADGGYLCEDLVNAAWQLACISRLIIEDSPADQADQRLAAIQVARADIETVRAAAIGDRVEIISPDQGVINGLRIGVEGIQELDDFMERPADDRQHLLGTYDAAASLLATFAPARAVA
jgi:hypothetical protein